MSLARRVAWFCVLLGFTALALPGAANAQSACVTPNCVFAGAPAICSLRAAPRTPTVFMGEGFSNVFVPANPKIEPGDCILWVSASSTHDASGAACPDVSNCGSPSPPACQFETGNVSSMSGTPSSTCFYDSATFPAGTGNAYYCRIHASPTTGTMRGTLQVTTPIVLVVDKETASSSVKLSWTGGGVTDDFSYKVVLQSGGDPAFPAGTTTTVDPDGGVLGTEFVDVGELAGGTARYYLVRNRQSNEP